MRLAIPPSVLAPVCLALGGFALVWAALAYRAQRRFLSKSARVNAVVQSLRVETLGRGRGAMYFPMFQFTTASGVEVTTESHTTQSGIQVGQRIAVFYDPNDPNQVEVDSFWSHWGVVFIALSFALILLVSAAAALVALFVSSSGG